MKHPSTYGIRVVERAGSVLHALAATDEPWALSAVADAVGLSRPTTFRLLRTLEDLRFVQSDDGRYALGIGILELAQAITRQLDVVAITRPLLVALRNELDETCGLTIRSGDFCVPIAQVEASQSVRRVLPLGAHRPLYASSAGKVILADYDEADLDAYLVRTPLIAFSSATTTEPEQLRAQLRDVRQQGACWGVNGRGDGGASVSFPVRRYDGQLAAVAVIVCPVSRFTEELRERCVLAGSRESRRMSEALGLRHAPTWSPSATAGTVARQLPRVAKSIRAISREGSH
jgi:DNA-binding IclR family transcriptional regulator